MLGIPTPQQQQQRIDELTEAVYILGGHVAALMAYIAVISPLGIDPLATKGAAQGLAPQPVAISKTAPAYAAAEAIDRIAVLVRQLQNPPQP